jgi:hypothetical protein
MTTRFPSRRFFLPLLLAGLALASGCEKADAPLAMADLSGAEYVFVERMVLLERAKAAALLDRPNGDVLLDSLAVAWGDSSLELTAAGAPKDPIRSEAVGALLRRVIQAEQESLMTTSGFDRWNLPLPEPASDPAPEPESVPPENTPES